MHEPEIPYNPECDHPEEMILRYWHDHDLCSLDDCGVDECHLCGAFGTECEMYGEPHPVQTHLTGCTACGATE